LLIKIRSTLIIDIPLLYDQLITTQRRRRAMHFYKP